MTDHTNCDGHAGGCDDGSVLHAVIGATTVRMMQQIRTQTVTHHIVWICDMTVTGAVSGVDDHMCCVHPPLT